MVQRSICILEEVFNEARAHLGFQTLLGIGDYLEVGEKTYDFYFGRVSHGPLKKSPEHIHPRARALTILPREYGENLLCMKDLFLNNPYLRDFGVFSQEDRKETYGGFHRLDPGLHLRFFSAACEDLGVSIDPYEKCILFFQDYFRKNLPDYQFKNLERYQKQFQDL